jgi:hypothetical protein
MGVPYIEEMKFMTKELENSEDVFLQVKNIIRDEEWLITSSVKDIERTNEMFKETGQKLTGRLKTQTENSMRENKVFYEMKESFDRQRKLRSYEFVNQMVVCRKEDFNEIGNRRDLYSSDVYGVSVWFLNEESGGFEQGRSVDESDINEEVELKELLDFWLSHKKKNDLDLQPSNSQTT